MNKKPKVLVVEDDPSHQMLASMWLKDCAEVIIAGSSRDALEVLREQNDILFVVLDGRVPRFSDGYCRLNDTTHDLAHYLVEFHPDIRVYTASSDDNLNDELAAIGCIKSTKVNAARMVQAEILKKG